MASRFFVVFLGVSMPYKISTDCGCPESKPYGVVKKDDGKRMGCHASEKEAKTQMAAIHANEGSMKMEAGMKNPVILGVAATNRPHVRLREHPMSIVEVDGKKMVRVPFMVKGKYRHPMGPLDFTDTVFDKMIENHRAKVGDFGEGLDVKHIPDLGSLAWFDPDSGGKIVKEDNLLVGYGVPTGDEALKIIENGRFKWASVEFHPDYKSTLEKKYLESTTIDSVDLGEETIQLANPYRDAFGKWAAKGGGAVKKVASAHKEFRGGVKESVKADLLNKNTKTGAAAHKAANTKTGSKSRKWGRALGKVAGRGAAVGVGAIIGHQIGKALGGKLEYGPIALAKEMPMMDEMMKNGKKMPEGMEKGKKKKVIKRAKKLEFEDVKATLVRDALQEYTETETDDYLWFDSEVFDWSEFNLPQEQSYYKVDKETASAMLAALNDLAQEQPDVFYTEEDMQTLEEALARIEELETEIETLRDAQEPEMTEREKAMASRIEALERADAEKSVRLEVETARNYKDAEGRGHSAVVLNFISDLMLGKPLGDGTVKLESFTDPGAIAQYFRDGLALFLKTAPGTQPVEPKTVVDDTRTLESSTEDLFEKGKAAGKSFWGRK